MNHNELVLSKKPVAYYPLSGDLLDYAGGPAATSSAVFTGSNDTTATVFFRGIPLVYGLSSSCVMKDVAGRITVNSKGMFSSMGKTRNMSMEFYLNTDSRDSSINTGSVILRSKVDTTQFQLGHYRNNYYIRILSGSNATVKSTTVYSDIPNVTKQIVINWSPSSLSFSVNGKTSKAIDISDCTWGSVGPIDLEFIGVGSTGSGYIRTHRINAVSIFPYALSSSEIDELRNAAFKDTGAAGVVARYGGEFISCNSQNIKRQGQFTVSTKSDWLDRTALTGLGVRSDKITDQSLTEPTYTGDKNNLVNANSKVTYPTGSGLHVDYTGFSEVIGADAVGCLFNNKGSGAYTSKEYVFTCQLGDAFLGIYTQSNNAYYEYINDSTGITESSQIASGIDAYSSSGRFFAGISARTSEVIFGDATASEEYNTLYSSASKVASKKANEFFPSAQIRLGGDVRVGSDTSTHFTGNCRALIFSFNSTGLNSGFYAFSPALVSTDQQPGMHYSGAFNVKWTVPAELLGYFDGTTTDIGSLLAFADSDSAASSQMTMSYKSTPGGADVYTSVGPTGAIPTVINSRIPEGTDTTSGIINISMSGQIKEGGSIYPTINAIEAVSYEVNSSGYVEIADGRSSIPFEVSPYMVIEKSQSVPAYRGLNSGVRSIGISASSGKQPRIVVPSGKTLYGISLWVNIDTAPSTYNLTSGTYSRIDFIDIPGAVTLELRSPASFTKYNGLDIINGGTNCRTYINGSYVPYSGSEPDSPGLAPSNVPFHLFVALNSPINGPVTVTFDKSFLGDGSFFTSFEQGIAYNDIAVYTASSFPTTNATKDAMAKVIASPYIASSSETTVQISESTLPIKAGDGISFEVSRQWKPLIN